MSKVTVTKLQIAQTKECVVRLDKYVRMIDIATELLMFAKHESQYNRLPERYKMEQRKDIEVVINDLKSMKAEAQSLALLKAEKATELKAKREKELEQQKC